MINDYDKGAVLIKTIGFVIVIVEIVFYYFIIKDEKTQLLMSQFILYTILMFLFVCMYIPAGIKPSEKGDNEDKMFLYKLSVFIIFVVHVYYFTEKKMYVQGFIIALIELMIISIMLVSIGQVFTPKDGEPIDGILKIMENIIVYVVFNGVACIALPILFVLYLIRKDEEDDVVY